VSNNLLTGFTGYSGYSFSQFPASGPEGPTLRPGSPTGWKRPRRDETEKDIIPCEQIVRGIEYTPKVCGISPETSNPKPD